MTSQWKRHWLDVVAPDEPHKLTRRMAWDGLTEERFHETLRESPSTRDKTKSRWKKYLSECCQALINSWDQPLLPVAPENDQRPFEDLWHPIRKYALELLKEDLKEAKNIDGAVLVQLADSLLKRLCFIGEQVLWASFNAGRSPGTMLLAHLGTNTDGASAPVREKYECFIQLNRKNGLEALLKEFPEFGRYIGTVVMLWRENSSEMLKRICQDRQIIEELFAIPKDKPLATVRQGLSDPHRGGRGSGGGERERRVFRLRL